MTSTLTTIDQLSNLVDLDKKVHKLKDIAQLFIEAMTDWPTFSQTEISDFVKEVKEYFGTPLTKEKISDKTLNVSDSNLWQHEAGSSIIELLDISERFCNQADFDKILQDILSYYEQLLKNIDFIAELKYLTTEEGGRSMPAFSGYRPQVKFDFAEMQTSGQQTFLNKEIVYPGDKVEAAMKIISVEFFANSLSEGMSF